MTASIARDSLVLEAASLIWIPGLDIAPVACAGQQIAEDLLFGRRGATSLSGPRSAGRASAYGSVVWQDMQYVPRSRAALGHVVHHSARSSRYRAAALTSHPEVSGGPASSRFSMTPAHNIATTDVTKTCCNEGLMLTSTKSYLSRSSSPFYPGGRGQA